MLLSMHASTLVARNREDYLHLLRRLLAPSARPRLLALRSAVASERLRSPLYKPRYLARGMERLSLSLWDLFRNADDQPASHHVSLASDASFLDFEA
mmetsp:Transcript_57771/g.132314  ORF Transcript_57771/g.132314 Transcript_57771/m.132314 type:complete len:97 (+) Transcript_57771:2-292(+)